MKPASAPSPPREGRVGEHAIEVSRQFERAGCQNITFGDIHPRAESVHFDIGARKGEEGAILLEQGDTRLRVDLRRAQADKPGRSSQISQSCRVRWRRSGQQDAIRAGAMAFIRLVEPERTAKQRIRCRAMRHRTMVRCKVEPFATLQFRVRACKPLFGNEQPGGRALGVVVSFNEKVGTEGIEHLVALVRDDMTRVNEMILSRTGSDVAMIPEVAQHLISSGGKRLRPMLTLATAQLSGVGGNGHIRLAAAVEFMHTATLLHDDVVDESDLRRGKPSARKVWGNEASVLVGDFLLGQAFRMMVEVGSLPCLDVLSTAAAVIAEGEVMQLAAAKNTATTEDDYLAVIRSKTAALFAAAAEVGPLLAETGEAQRRACRSYGMNLGVAFQLIDDALDYGGSGAKLGKNVGDDFREENHVASGARLPTRLG